MQRKQPAILVKSLELAVIARIFHAKRTGESVLPNPAGRLSHLFLWEASEQSAFKDSIRRIATIRGLGLFFLALSPHIAASGTKAE